MNGELRLLADIGGTNARFALEARGGQFADVEVLACADYATLDDAMRAYLGRAAGRALAVDIVRHAAIAIANPVEDDQVSMTNHHWSFSIEALRLQQGLATLLVVNDFAALAMSLPHLAADGRERIGGGIELANRPIGLIGPGTGLGVSGVIPAGGNRWIALAGEGGHVSFAPANKEEAAILEALWGEYGHVSAERLLSGMGLELIHWALTGKRLDAPAITGAALDGSSSDCRRTVDTFCAILGSVAGNVALTLGATGGMYIGGGIAPRLGKLFTESSFRARFEDKGRLRPYLARIPTYLITEQYPALRGVSAMLSDRVAALP
ncbi:glucokinase [Telluria aromaticivorans]|uniref:Glucokinase n=1 Tax=Telluria aromaticivorans TaxID=2725995 RepID=A0A7Y2K039_9BURK|nr:glucokinase [Telluria aromaticivorans]NNG24155.1 glucokinase [Telluria aromaticivorans]